MLADRMRLLPFAVACCLGSYAGATAAQEDDLPDMAFLEYLGSWEESDEDWLLVSNAEKTRERKKQDESSDAPPDSGESMENDG